MEQKDKLKKYSVHGAVSGSKYIGTFAAKTEEEALKQAWNCSRAHVGLCHQCSSECEDPEIEDMYIQEVDDDAEVDNGEGD